MSTENITQEILSEIENKLQRYRDAHNGKAPARIFMSSKTYLLFSRALVLAFMEPPLGNMRWSGIPVVVFNSYDGPGIFLSEESEEEGYR